MIGVLGAAAIGLTVTLLGTPVAIRLFRTWGWGQRIREDGPHTHMEKMGTPTMGGIVILVALVLGYVVTRLRVRRVHARRLVVDRGGARVRSASGSSTTSSRCTAAARWDCRCRRSSSGTALVSLLFALLVVHFASSTGSSTELSFIRETGIKLGIVFYLWAFIVLTASSHAVNLTDGLDGLASGSSIFVLSAYVFIAFWQFRHACEIGPATACYEGVDQEAMLDAAVVAAATMGAVAGFLWWNASPARIFMGDTGSLSLGGLFGALAITTNTQLLLVIMGGLFVIETMSVILQVISFRGFGRRIFRMSPIHHHFELAGWPEFTVIVRFWIVAGLCVAVGLGLYYADFIARGGSG